MRYFDEQLVANSRPHQQWWGEVSMAREHFHRVEDSHAALYGEISGVQNASAILPRDAWLELDTITRTVMRDDGGEVFMADLMALAKPVNIGKLVHMTRVASDTANPVIRSMSGQVPVPMDKTVYDYRGVPVPIFSDGYGREWREWNTLQSENFDALADDQEGSLDKLRRNMADYVLDGDPSITFQGYGAKGIRTSTYSKVINLGSAGGGANIDLTSPATTTDAIIGFFANTFGAMLDSNLISEKVNVYISPEIGRNFDRDLSTSSGFKGGSLWEHLEKNRRINKLAVTHKLTGNEFFGFVPKSQFIRPIVGMAVNTTAMTRLNPTDNYQFLNMGAMGLEIGADYNGKAGVFHTTDLD